VTLGINQGELLPMFRMKKDKDLLSDIVKQSYSISSGALSALQEENKRLREDNSSLREALMAFCHEAHTRLTSSKIQQRRASVAPVDFAMSTIESMKAENDEERKQKEEAKSVAQQIFGGG